METIFADLPALFLRVFPRPFRHGGCVPPRTSAEEKVLIWGFMREGEHRHYGGGPKSDRLYHKLKILLLLLQVMQLLLL